MIKPLNSPQLSAAKTRTGLQSISELLPRLIRQYELQAELVKRREENAARRDDSRPMPIVALETRGTEQATFGWYE